MLYEVTDSAGADHHTLDCSAGKSTLLKLLTGENEPSMGKVNRNGRLRIGYFAQHHLDQLDLDLSPVAFLAQKFPGRSEQEYRQHLGGFGITGMTGLQTLKTLSGGQKSRVTFALLSLQRWVFAVFYLPAGKSRFIERVHDQKQRLMQMPPRLQTSRSLARRAY